MDLTGTVMPLQMTGHVAPYHVFIPHVLTHTIDDGLYHELFLPLSSVRTLSPQGILCPCAR